MRRFHQDLAAYAVRRPWLSYYYVTVREMAELPHQAEAGAEEPEFNEPDVRMAEMRIALNHEGREDHEGDAELDRTMARLPKLTRGRREFRISLLRPCGPQFSLPLESRGSS